MHEVRAALEPFAETSSIVVDAATGTGPSSIGAAVKVASDGTIIRVRPGTYRESITITKEGRGTFEHCDVYANALAGVEIQTKGNPKLVHCTLHDGKHGGIYVLDEGRGTFEDCQVYANTLAGIYVTTKGDPKLVRCALHDGKQSGIHVYDEGRGTFEDCHVHSNAIAGVNVATHGDPRLIRCSLYDGTWSGIYVFDEGRGAFEDCHLHSKGPRMGESIESRFEMDRGGSTGWRRHDLRPECAHRMTQRSWSDRSGAC